MMKKTARKNLLMDRLHKGFVLTCIAATVYGTFWYSMRFANYFLNTKPVREKKELLQSQELLKEGSYDKLLVDPAQTIKS